MCPPVYCLNYAHTVHVRIQCTYIWLQAGCGLLGNVRRLLKNALISYCPTYPQVPNKHQQIHVHVPVCTTSQASEASLHIKMNAACIILVVIERNNVHTIQ